MKTGLQEWSKHTFKRANHKIKKLKRDIGKLHNLPPTAENIEKRFRLKKEVKELWKQEEMYWGTRAKVNWLRWGDRNTKYFHATTMQRRENNTIHRVKNRNGEWIEDNTDIMKCFQDAYEEIYKGSEGEGEEEACQFIQPLITPQDNAWLLKEVKQNEVKEVVFSLGANKALDPDGLSGIFYQKAWNTIARDTTNMVKEVFKEGKLPENLNETRITLIPKIPNHEEVSQYRTISCCNFLMKIITRIMALRMKPLMNKIIATNQSAFVIGR